MSLHPALHLRRHFQRVVLTRPWATFVVLGLAFFCFGVGTLNRLHTLTANADFLLMNGWRGLMDGGAVQLVGLLFDGYLAMAAYVVMKTCEHALTDWVHGRHEHPSALVAGDNETPH